MQGCIRRNLMALSPNVQPAFILTMPCEDFCRMLNKERSLMFVWPKCNESYRLCSSFSRVLQLHSRPFSGSKPTWVLVPWTPSCSHSRTSSSQNFHRFTLRLLPCSCLYCCQVSAANFPTPELYFMISSAQLLCILPKRKDRFFCCC